MRSLARSLIEKIEQRTARVGVVGLGYVGLPLAVEFARAGLTTTGIDLDSRKVESINGGRSYIPDVQTADEVVKFAQSPGISIYHAVGSAAMGPEDDDVVAPDLRVRGVEGLRVADISILPEQVSGNTAAPANAVGGPDASTAEDRRR